MTRSARIAIQVVAPVVGLVSGIFVNFATNTLESRWWVILGFCGVATAVLALISAFAAETREVHGPPVEMADAYPTTDTPSPSRLRKNMRTVKVLVAVLILVLLTGVSVTTGRWMGIGMPLESLARVGKNLVLAPGAVTIDGLTLTVEEVESWGGKTTVTMSITNRTQYGTLYLLPRGCRLVLPSGEAWAGETGWEPRIQPMMTAGGTVRFDGELPLKVASIEVGFVNIGPPGPESIYVEDLYLRN